MGNSWKAGYVPNARIFGSWNCCSDNVQRNAGTRNFIGAETSSSTKLPYSTKVRLVKN